MQQVILIKAIETLGRRGAVVRVRDGYANNYLYPHGVAVRATADNMKRLEGLREKFAEEEKVRAAAATALATRVQSVSITLTMKASDEGHLYGSVNVATLVEALKGQGVELEPRAIRLAEPIKQIGVYTVPVVLHEEVKTELKVWVVEEKEPAAAAEAAEAPAKS